MFLWRLVLPLQGVINRGPPLFFLCIDWHGCPWINKHTKRHVIHIVQQTITRSWTFLSFYRFLRYAHLGNQDDTPPLQTKLPLALVLFSFVPLVGFRSDYITVPDLRLRSCHSRGRVGKRELLVEQNLLFPLVCHCLFAVYEQYSDVFQAIIFSYHSNFCTRILYMYLIK